MPRTGRPPRVKDGPDLPPAEFPYVDSKLLVHAPPCCPRCQGIWRNVDEGYVCTVCGRRWRAGDCLLKLVSRTLAHAEAWPVVRMNNPIPPKGPQT